MTQTDLPPTDPLPLIAPENPQLTRRNFALLVGDVSTYFIGMGFIDAATVLPALVAQLGGNALWLGALLALKQAGWYLPQPVSAHLLMGKREYLGYLRAVTFWGRIGYFPAALCVWLWGGSHRNVALWAFALAYTLCWFADGAGGVPWTAFIGRAIPAHRRGGLFATTQFLSGFSRLLVGGIVAWVLSGKAVAFPGNLALLVLACGVGVMASWGCLAALREPPLAPGESPIGASEGESFGAYLRSFPARFRERPFLLRLAMVQTLAQTGAATIPFLLPEDAAKSGLPGLLLAVQTVGLMAFALLWGTLTDRRGPRHSLAGQFLVGLALCAAAVASLVAGPLSRPLLLGAYFLFGGIMDAWATATNYQLESLPERERATYIGLMNAATAPTLLLPLLAGLIASTLGKTVLFVLAAAVMVAGFLLARGLPDTRRKAVG